MFAAIILSGGKSSRMGSPKALLPYQGWTFLEHLLSLTQENAGTIGITRIVLGAHTEEIISALKLAPENVVVNPLWEQGQLSSIQVAIRSLPRGADAPDGIILFLVDHPLISAALVGKLAREFQRSGKPIVIPTFHGKRGHPVIFAARLYDELLAAPADQGARAVVWAHANEILEVPTEEEGVLLNLNDPDTLRHVT